MFSLGESLLAQIPKSIDVKPGISLSNQSWYKDNNKQSSNNPYYAGLFVSVNLEFMQHKWMSILAEGGFTMKSYTSSGNNSLDYVYLSPLFKARMEFGKFIPYLFLGPRIDFLLRTKVERESGSPEPLNKYIYGLMYGIGLEYIFWPFGISLGFHQQNDFNNIADYINSVGVEHELKQNTFVINLGLKAYFGDKGSSK